MKKDVCNYLLHMTVHNRVSQTNGWQEQMAQDDETSIHRSSKCGWTRPAAHVVDVPNTGKQDEHPCSSHGVAWSLECDKTYSSRAHLCSSFVEIVDNGGHQVIVLVLSPVENKHVSSSARMATEAEKTHTCQPARGSTTHWLVLLGFPCVMFLVQNSTSVKL